MASHAMRHVGAVERAARRAALQTFGDQAEAMVRLAIRGTKVEPESLTTREKEFAATLLRHAKGVQVAAAAWRQELGTQ